jgi:hypothetical protein
MAYLVVTVLPASAGVGFSVVPDFPTSVTVGQTGIAATYTITNNSDGAQTVGNVTMLSMTMVPSCSNFSTNCSTGTADPNTFTLSATGTGQAGTGCAGTVFTITVTTPATGEVTFVPSTPVVLGPPSLSNDLDLCRISFTFSVNTVPNNDSSPATPGLQTSQIGFAQGLHDDLSIGTGSGSDTTTVAQATPTIVTQASGPVPVGGQITDTATLSGGVSATGTITFRLFGPGNDQCSGTPAFTSTSPVTANGNVTSASFTPTAAGTYHWVAQYSGDANNAAAGPTACNDTNEDVVITPVVAPTPTATPTPTPTPTPRPSPSPSATSGQSPSPSPSSTTAAPPVSTPVGAVPAGAGGTAPGSSAPLVAMVVFAALVLAGGGAVLVKRRTRS